jgi:hypothetical protein
LLLDSGIALAIVADEFADPLLPVAIEFEQTQTLSTTLIGPLSRARPQMEQARPSIERARQAWARVPVDTLPASLQSHADSIEPLLELLEASIELTVAADATADALAPVLYKHTDPSIGNSELLTYLAEAGPAMEQAQEALARARAQWAQVPLGELPAPLQPRLQQITHLLAQAQDGLALASILPALLGLDGPQTYTFIAQNPDELRASGGFISAVGELTFERGELTDFWVDRTEVLRQTLYPPSPEPFERYMNISYWVLHDANWSPDFPTAAETLRSLYHLERGERPGNMIAFTPTTIQYVLEAIGPVPVEGVADPESTTLVSAESLQQYMQDQYNLSESQGVYRKAFLEPLMEAIIERLQSETEDIHELAIGRAVLRALNERHMLIAMENPEIAGQLALHQWDGGVQPGAHDFLMAVDSNMGYNKSNLYIQQAMTYTVDLRNPAAPEAEVIVRHTHTLPGSFPCQHVRYREQRQPGDLPYAYHARQCYWDYLRVLVPADSQLTNVQTQPLPVEWNLSDLDNGAVTISQERADTLMIGTFLIVPSGGTRETVLRYRLPPEVLEQTAEGWRYRLVVQKQAGREAIPITVYVHLPPGMGVAAAAPALQNQDGQRITWNATLATDQVFDIIFVPENTTRPNQQPQGMTP